MFYCRTMRWSAIGAVHTKYSSIHANFWNFEKDQVVNSLSGL
ncbi:hypothetical protein Pint_32611 [Pistacia integerrima]|uniref:Uncharacterized protein n=1 Tax=Pistacia integerrima TaxID=434235 RepID=A0ACC0XPH1_9ROSI|nr:hypothetical protein Pint_32611 [Pistacia integerrima]